ncbi:hypothetical protein L798_01026 [Zootermopsis nevadensis]|uniref:Histone-lysine N-methyltransferase SETMAR n=1 Tax=Zootermopsis nevadensis TaxID=136037 RepID=A0A067QM76_ZOONE|nr:hypothetical protein L798_01026 [Zootermopsis nevadensis]
MFYSLNMATVLRLRPYHPDLNPIELIRGLVKEYVAREDVSFRLDDAIKPAEEKFSIITKEEWSSRCNKSRQCEKNYFRLEPIIDDVSGQIIVNLQNDSDTNSRSSCKEKPEDDELR